MQISKKTDVMLTWAATNSIPQELRKKESEKKRKTCTGIVAPLSRRPPTDIDSPFTTLCMAQGISAQVVGPQRKTIITLDLDLYERAVKLQEVAANSNWFLRAGELRACFASMHAIGKYIEGSGLDSIGIETGLYAPATIRQILSDKQYKRGLEFQITNALACYELIFEALDLAENVSDKCLLL